MVGYLCLFSLSLYYNGPCSCRATNSTFSKEPVPIFECSGREALPFIADVDVPYAVQDNLKQLYEIIAEDSTYLDFYGNRFWRETYAYDEANNIDYRLDGWGKMDYSYNDGDRLTQLGEKSFSYDPNGNLSIETLGVQAREYTYTPENRAARIIEVNPQALLPEAGKSFDIAYGYDGLGRKVLASSTMPEVGHGQHDNIRHEYCYYDGLSFEKTLERLEEVGHNGRVTLEALNEYHYGYGEILSLQDVREDFSGAWRGQRERTNLFQDVLGSTVYATRKNHGEAFSYDAFGRDYEGNLEFDRNIGYNGKRMDPFANIAHYGFRDYSPQMKRFTTIDPIRSGLNWYVYCSNDPINFIDLFGLLESDIQAAHGVGFDPYNPSGDANKPGPVPEEPDIDSNSLTMDTTAWEVLAGVETVGLGGLIIYAGSMAGVVSGGIFIVAGVTIIFVGIDLLEGDGLDMTTDIINSLTGN